MKKFDEQHFETINGQKIRCCCSTSENSVEILIENLPFVVNRKRNIQQTLAILLGCILLNVVIGHHAILIGFNVIFFVTIATKCYTLINSVEFEKLRVIDGLSLEYTTKYCFGKSHKYLPIECIHDVVINEVIFGFRTIYIMQVLMKGIQFQNRRVVPLLSELNPRIACLQLVYNLLRKRISSIK